MVKPWPEITTMEEAVEYIDAELAEAEKYCPASVSAYQTAFSLAQSYVSTQEYGAEQWSALEGFLTDARSVWHENGCTKSGGASPPPATTPPKQAPYVPPPKEAGILGGGSSGMLLIGIVAGVAAWFIWGKKGKAGRKTKSRGRKVPRRRRRRR